MTIGSIIKKLRREHDMTQEQLAECLGISAASVSQWECDRTAPDISQLPILANIFEVTTDYILGVDIARRDHDIQIILNTADSHKNNGHAELALPVLKQGLARFPTSHKIMLRLMQTYSASSVKNAERDYNHSEIIRLGRKILSESNDDRIRNGARQILCYTYEALGMYNEIKDLAGAQSSLSTSYEDFMVRAHTGTKKYLYKKLHLASTLRELIRNMSRINTALDDGSMAYTPEEEIKIRKKIIALIDIIIDDRRYGFFGDRIFTQYQKIAALYADIGDGSAVLVNLKAAADQAVWLDTAYDPKEKYGGLLLRGNTFGRVSFHSAVNFSMELANEMKSSRYDFVKDEPEYRVIYDQLMQHAAERY